MKNEYALITGASSGIGLEIAKRLASDGYNLVLTARRLDLLEKLSNEITNSHGVKVAIVSEDLSEESAPKEIHDFCKSNNLNVSILINNAGYGIKTSFHETSIEDEEAFMQEAATTPRSNCVLDSSKLESAGILLRPVEEAVRSSLREMKLSSPTVGV